MVAARRDGVKAGARVVLTRASSTETASGSELLERATQYTSDLKEMGMTMQLIRRNVAGAKNDLKVGRKKTSFTKNTRGKIGRREKVD